MLAASLTRRRSWFETRATSADPFVKIRLSLIHFHRHLEYIEQARKGKRRSGQRRKCVLRRWASKCINESRNLTRRGALLAAAMWQGRGGRSLRRVGSAQHASFAAYPVAQVFTWCVSPAGVSPAAPLVQLFVRSSSPRLRAPSNKDGFWHDFSSRASRPGNPAKETAGGRVAQNRYIRRVAKNVPKPVLI